MDISRTQVQILVMRVTMSAVVVTVMFVSMASAQQPRASEVHQQADHADRDGLAVVNYARRGKSLHRLIEHWRCNQR